MILYSGSPCNPGMPVAALWQAAITCCFINLLSCLPRWWCCMWSRRTAYGGSSCAHSWPLSTTGAWQTRVQGSCRSCAPLMLTSPSAKDAMKSSRCCYTWLSLKAYRASTWHMLAWQIQGRGLSFSRHAVCKAMSLQRWSLSCNGVACCCCGLRWASKQSCTYACVGQTKKNQRDCTWAPEILLPAFRIHALLYMPYSAVDAEQIVVHLAAATLLHAAAAEVLLPLQPDRRLRHARGVPHTDSEGAALPVVPGPGRSHLCSHPAHPSGGGAGQEVAAAAGVSSGLLCQPPSAVVS